MSSSESNAQRKTQIELSHPLTLVSSQVERLPFRASTLGEFLSLSTSAITDLLHQSLAVPSDRTTSMITPFESAALGRDILSAIVQNEVGTSSLEEGAGMFFHKCWGGGAELRLLTKVYTFSRLCADIARKELCWGAMSRYSFGYTTVQAYLHDLLTVVRWYGQRRVSLLLLEEECPRDAQKTTLFGFRVLHDRFYDGIFGIEVVAGARLSGLAGMPVWFKVYFKEGTRTITHTQSWSDTIISDSEQGEVHRRVGGSLPLVPELHRTVLDEMRVFIPYAALGLQPGKQTVEVVGELSATPIGTLTTASHVVSLMIPPQAWIQKKLPPSDASYGLWRCDPVSGDSISRVLLEEEEGIVHLMIDGFITDRYGEELTLRIEAFDREGYSLESSDRAGDYDLPLCSPYAVLSGMKFSFPISSYAVQPTAFEITIRNPQTGYIVVGTRVSL